VLDISHAYLHWNLDSIDNGYITKIDKEYQLDNMKLGKINMDVSSSFKIQFSNDDHTGIHVCFKRLLLEYAMLYQGVNEWNWQLILFGNSF
jgi:hypothetical protein